MCVFWLFIYVWLVGGGGGGGGVVGLGKERAHDSVRFFEEFIWGGNGGFFRYLGVPSTPEEVIECWG